MEKEKGQKRAGINYVCSTGGCCSHMSYFVVIVIIKCRTGGILSHHCPTESPGLVLAHRIAPMRKKKKKNTAGAAAASGAAH